MQEKNTIINCHYRDKENKIKFFCDIIYRQGTEFVLKVYSREAINMQNGNFICYDGENNMYVLNNLLSEESPNKYFYDKRYYFQSLVKGTRKHEIGEKYIDENNLIKFKSVYFTFPYINTFFFNIDYLCSENSEASEPSLIYKKNKNIKFEPINVNGFNIKLMSGYSYGAGSIGSHDGHFSLIKSIKISSQEERELKDFIEVVTTLTKFFSICLKRKLLISNIWSNSEENTLHTNCEIKTFQFYILNKDYQEDINPYKTLATYALLQNNFEEVVNKYFQTKQEQYERFPVFCELYMRYNDAPIEILPQMKFLPLMQGIEAYIAKFPFNNLEEIPSETKSLLKRFKEENSQIDHINELDFPQQLPFQKKINNTIQHFNLENIIKLKLTQSQNYKLINQMVKIRNYYTHYGDYPKISDEDFYDAMFYAKIICEIFIMKELNFTEEQIKISLENNYYYLRQIDNKYCCLNNDIKIPKGFQDKKYVGEIDSIVKNQLITYMLFYKISKNKKQVELYAKSTRKYGRTQKKILPLKLAEKDYNNLNKIFKRCYDNYLESEEQIRYQNELKNKKTKKETI